MSVHKKNHPFDRNVKKVLSETKRVNSASYTLKKISVTFSKNRIFSKFSSYTIHSTHTLYKNSQRERERMSVHKKRHPFDRNVKKVLSETRREAESIVRGSGKRFKRTSSFRHFANSHISIYLFNIFFRHSSYIYICITMSLYLVTHLYSFTRSISSYDYTHT